MTEAIQSDRNSGSPSGAQAETERRAAIGSATGILIISAMRNSYRDQAVFPLVRRLKHNETGTAQAPAAQDLRTVRRPPRIHILAHGIRELADAAAVAVHDEDLKSVF